MKYIVSAGRMYTHLGQSVTDVEEFVYLGTMITSDNIYYGLSTEFKSRDLTRRTKIALYKLPIIPVLQYGAEAWTMTAADKAPIGVFKQKILWRIYGLLKVGTCRAKRWLEHVTRITEKVPVIKGV